MLKELMPALTRYADSGDIVAQEAKKEIEKLNSLFDLIEENCLSLRVKLTKIGVDDTDVQWEVVQHGFDGVTTLLTTQETPRAALNAASEILSR